MSPHLRRRRSWDAMLNAWRSKKQNLTKSTSSASQVTFQQSKPWLPGNISESIPHLNPPFDDSWFLLLGRETPDFFGGWPWVGLHKSQHFVFRSIAMMFLCVVGPQVQCMFMRWGGGCFHPMWSRWPTQLVWNNKPRWVIEWYRQLHLTQLQLQLHQLESSRVLVTYSY